MAKKKLRRSSANKKVAGVCGGIANYHDIKAFPLRLIFFVSIFFGGLGLLIYVILWALLKQE